MGTWLMTHGIPQSETKKKLTQQLASLASDESNSGRMKCNTPDEGHLRPTK